jgi:hypothetical protein
MKFWIKTSLSAALLASVVLGGAAAMAGHDGHGRGGNARPEQAQERLGQRVEEQLARLELALVLTPEQKAAWAEFRQGVKGQSGQIAAQFKERHEAGAGKPGTAFESLQILETANKEHARNLAETRKIVEAFYGKLGAAQKTVFDAEFNKFLHHGRPGERR